MIRVENISKSYGKVQAINKLNFNVKEGQLYGLIGPDGAGKTSLFRILTTLLIPNKGKAIINNFDTVKDYKQIRNIVGYMPERFSLYMDLSVEENLNFFATVFNTTIEENYYLIKDIYQMLEPFKNRKAGDLSGGMKQKLALSCALIHKPKVLLLDEPTTGVDPLSRLELWEILDTIRKEEGSIILVSTAYMQEASKMDRVMLFDEGKIIADGTAQGLLASIQTYTYEITEQEENKDCISFDKKSYALHPLNAKHTPPTLEGLFFVNALKQNKILPPIEIQKRERTQEIPEVVMSAEKITKRFGSFIANDAVDIQLKRGEILGLLGANGAGKTTFIKMLLGLYPIDAGELKLLNKSIQTQEDRRALKSKIGYVSQHFALYNDITIRENLLYFANMHKIPLSDALNRIKKYAFELGFEQYMDKFPTELPLGVNQRFSIATALLHEPVILFLDEPTSGVDTIARAQFWKILHTLKEVWGISILITTHYMSEAEYCDRVVLLKDGKKIADDSVQNFYKEHPDAQTFEDIFLTYFRSQS